jgi:transketolase
MRKEFGKVISELVVKDKSIYVLDLDFGNIFGDLLDSNPEHLLKLGVTEQAAMGVASGMALEGLKPYVFGITPFVLERPFEQIKLDIVQQKANVKIMSYWGYPTAGPTHKALDVEKECEILGIKLIEPKNSEEARKEILKGYESVEPLFFYMTKNDK